MKVIRYGSLLELAHEKGIRRVATTLLQAPTEANGWMAIVSAVVETDDGASFAGLGDASPESVKRPLVPHLLRVAETRSKARALKDMLGVSATSLEELGEDEGPLDEAPANVHALAPRGPSRFSPMTDAQCRYLMRLHAQQGIRGGAAERAICEAVGVSTLEEVDRHAASALIDQLKRGAESA